MQPEKRERPILFSGEMVRAIIGGRKSQTRRVIKPQPKLNGEMHGQPMWYWQSSRLNAGYCHTNADAMCRLMVNCCPYGVVGDHLWVRETCWIYGGKDRDEVAGYVADCGEKFSGYAQKVPSIHMPRWASRITLEIEDVRVQRVQKISEDDAKAEGAQEYGRGYPEMVTHRWGFEELWNQINAKRGYSWESNPWVWVVTFKRIKP